MDDRLAAIRLANPRCLYGPIMLVRLQLLRPHNSQALENSGTAIGVRCKDGIVFGVEKLIMSKMLVAGSGRRIATIDEHVGAVRGELPLPTR